MENPFAEKLEGLDTPNHGKLSFEEQCGYYAGLMLTRARPGSPDRPWTPLPCAVVAHAAGVGSATISHLLAAGHVRSGVLRYPRVAAEYAKLGHEAFVHRYLTPIIRERIDQAIDAFKRKKRNPDVNERGWNPRANGYCRRFDWPQTSIGLPAHFIIQAVPDLHGYAWRNLKPRHDLPELRIDEAPLQGDPTRNGQGYATSEDCFRWVKKYLDPKQ